MIRPQDGDILESEKIGENDKASVEREIFQQIKTNNCTYQPDILCIDSAGTTVADLGIWEKALSLDDMVGWSSCRWVHVNLSPGACCIKKSILTAGPFPSVGYDP